MELLHMVMLEVGNTYSVDISSSGEYMSTSK